MKELENLDLGENKPEITLKKVRSIVKWIINTQFGVKYNIEQGISNKFDIDIDVANKIYNKWQEGKTDITIWMEITGREVATEVEDEEEISNTDLTLEKVTNIYNFISKQLMRVGNTHITIADYENEKIIADNNFTTTAIVNKIIVEHQKGEKTPKQIFEEIKSEESSNTSITPEGKIKEENTHKPGDVEFAYKEYLKKQYLAIKKEYLDLTNEDIEKGCVVQDQPHIEGLHHGLNQEEIDALKKIIEFEVRYFETHTEFDSDGNKKKTYENVLQKINDWKPKQ